MNESVLPFILSSIAWEIKPTGKKKRDFCRIVQVNKARGAVFRRTSAKRAKFFGHKHRCNA
jgi:hypothetical protein